MTGTPTRSFRPLDGVGYLIAAAIAIVLLLGASRGIDPVRLEALRRNVAALRERVENPAAAQDRERLEKMTAAVEAYAVAVERLSDRIVRRRYGVEEPPQVVPAGNHRWRAALRETLRQQARGKWSERASELELPEDRKDALVSVAVMAGSYREYVTERIRKRVLPAEAGKEKLDRIGEWETAAIDGLLGGEEE